MSSKTISKKIFSNLTVLYVEDTPEILEMGRETLGRFFRRVDAAQDGEEGYELFLKNSYDIIISDIKMPKMSGLELSEKIKEQKSDQPILITSAYDDSPSLLRLIKAGITNFILKPFSINHLLETLIPIAESIENQRAVELYHDNLEKMVEEKSKEINDQNRFLTNIINSLKIPFAVVDMNSYLVVDGNEEALSKLQVGKMNVHELLCGQHDDCNGKNHPCAVKMALDKQSPVSFEKIMNYKDIGPRFIRVEVFPTFDDFGNIDKSLIYLIDVTKDSQKEISRIAAEGKLKMQLNRQTLIADLAKILNSAPSFKAIIKNALFFISGSLDIPKVAVFRMYEKKSRFDLLEEYVVDDELENLHYLDLIKFQDLDPQKLQRLHEGSAVVYHGIEKMDEAEKAFCEKYGIGSMLLQPIVINDKSLGLLAFFTPYGFFWNYKNYSLYATIGNLLASTWSRSP